MSKNMVVTQPQLEQCFKKCASLKKTICRWFAELKYTDTDNVLALGTSERGDYTGKHKKRINTIVLDDPVKWNCRRS